MNKVYNTEVLSVLHLILEDYERNASKDDLAYNLKQLIDLIENSEVVEEVIEFSI